MRNGGRIIARIDALDGRHEAVVIEGEGLGVGTCPDVHVRTRGGWPVRDTLLWRGFDETPQPRDVRFTTPEQIEIIDYRGCRYLVGFSTQTLDPQSPTAEPLTPVCT